MRCADRVCCSCGCQSFKVSQISYLVIYLDQNVINSGISMEVMLWISIFLKLPLIVFLSLPKRTSSFHVCHFIWLIRLKSFSSLFSHYIAAAFWPHRAANTFIWLFMLLIWCPILYQVYPLETPIAKSKPRLFMIFVTHWSVYLDFSKGGPLQCAHRIVEVGLLVALRFEYFSSK